MAIHTDFLWGVHNFGILVFPTISFTRREAIRLALSLTTEHANEIRPTVKNLKKHCPFYQVVRLSVAWEKP